MFRSVKREQLARRLLSGPLRTSARFRRFFNAAVQEGGIVREVANFASPPSAEEDMPLIVDRLTEERIIREEGLSPSFHLFWSSLAKKLRKEIDCEAESYPTVHDYLAEFWTPRMQQVTTELFPSNPYCELVIPAKCRDLIQGLFADPRVYKDPEYARRRKAEVLSEVERRIDSGLGIEESGPAHRPLEHEAEHRHWSQMQYDGKQYKEIAREVGKTPEHVRVNVQRHRKRKRAEQWLLRAAIYRRRFAT